MTQEIFQTVFKVTHAGGSGSCFYLKSINLFVTNYHVVKGFHKVAIHDDTFNSYVATVVLINPSLDIALLSVEHDFTYLPELKLADIASVHTGNRVSVAGFPYGMPLTVTEGSISASKQLIGDKYYLQIDAAINPGNSGGPVFSPNEEVVGISVSKINDADNMGFAIQVETLKTLIESIEDIDRSCFHLQCDGCDELIDQKESYCPSCGEKIDDESFEQRPISDVATFCEAAISEIGIDPIIARYGYEEWEFYHGSSRIEISIYNDEYLMCESHINLLPKKNVEAVIDYMLSADNYPYKMGLVGRQIYVIYRTHLSDLSSEDGAKTVMANICGLSKKADELDDMFVNKYGCEYAKKANVNQ